MTFEGRGDRLVTIFNEWTEYPMKELNETGLTLKLAFVVTMQDTCLIEYNDLPRK